MAYDRREFMFTWKIENFSLCAIETGTALASPTFRAESIGRSEWFLKLYPRGLSNNKYVSCWLCRLDNDEEDKIDFKVKMIGENDEILSSGKSIKGFVKEKSLGWEEFITIEKLNEKMENWKNDILKINCFLESYSKTIITDPVSRSEAWTKFGVERCRFQWNVKFFDTLNFKNKKEIYLMKYFQFELTLVVSDDEIEINIRRLEKDISTTQLVSCKISLVNLYEDEIVSKASKHLFKRNYTDAENNWKFPSFFSKKILVDKAHELMQDNSFTLMCELSVSNGSYLTELKCKRYGDRSSSNAVFLENSFSTLHNDLLGMLKTQKNTDIKICVNNLIVPAHKFMLVARSPVFSAMFDKGMTENQTGIVKIEDIDAKTLDDFLEYIYTGDVKGMEVENALPLLVAADKYQVSTLTEKCVSFLKSKLSVENVCEIYTLASTVNHERLKSSAEEFIKNNSAHVLSSNVWYDWMKGNVELANEILFKLALNFCP